MATVVAAAAAAAAVVVLVVVVKKTITPNTARNEKAAGRALALAPSIYPFAHL